MLPRRFFCILFALVLLSACSTQTLKPTPTTPQQNANWEQHQSTLDGIKQWKISGRFGAQSEEESWNGSINWVQSNDEYQINISGPLSSGSFSLHGDAKLSKLQIEKDKIYEAEDPELLLETYTGLRLPINNLRYWIIGKPSPLDSSSKVTLSSNGLLSQLTQKGWEITFRNYTKVNNISLPNKIFLENHEFDVRLAIKNWQLLG